MPVGTVRSYSPRQGEIAQSWYQVDASGEVLGRLAVRIANVLMGKHKPTYVPHMDSGDFVVVTNADKIKVTGNKRQDVRYPSYSHHPGGYKEVSMDDMFARHPERVLQFAVRRMLPKNAIGRRMLMKLKVYAGGEHPHAAQQPKPWNF